MLQDALGCGTLSFGKKKPGAKRKRRVVIMDEIDGLSGSDRGGSAALIKLIKSSATPIICICNDRQSSKVKGLANSCFDLRCKRPMKVTIAKRLVAVAAAEGLRLEMNAAELLVDSCGNDIRQCLNALQMWTQANDSGAATYGRRRRTLDDTRSVAADSCSVGSRASPSLSRCRREHERT